MSRMRCTSTGYDASMLKQYAAVQVCRSVVTFTHQATYITSMQSMGGRCKRPPVRGTLGRLNHQVPPRNADGKVTLVDKLLHFGLQIPHFCFLIPELRPESPTLSPWCCGLKKSICSSKHPALWYYNDQVTTCVMRHVTSKGIRCTRSDV